MLIQYMERAELSLLKQPHSLKEAQNVVLTGWVEIEGFDQYNITQGFSVSCMDGSDRWCPLYKNAERMVTAFLRNREVWLRYVDMD